MSNENIVCSHELVIRFEQLEDNTVNWIVQADAAIENTKHASLDELASAGAPLAVLGIRALSDLIHPNIIRAALSAGNMHLWKECYLRLSEQVSPGSHAIEGELAVKSDEAIVIH
jgi:predicted metal-dependent phosphoesterase TrpH